MKKILLTVILNITFSIVTFAASPMDMRFHCENDTNKINTLLNEGLKSNLKTSNELVVFYANKFLGTPYVAHTLEGETEQLTINIDELDCTTFVETLYALTRTTLSNRTSWRDYANNLESVRYRNGVIGDYSSRLHYISEWIINNSSRDNLKDITPDFSKCKYIVKTIDFMSKHRDAYASLKDDEMFNKVKNNEIGFRSHRFPYIKKEDINAKSTKATFKSGDFIAMVTNIKGLDVSHLGLVIKENNELYFINASMSGGKVQLEKYTFFEYLERVRSCIGVRVFRIKE
jgi:cell wall-associated NlpC family hydrolase